MNIKPKQNVDVFEMILKSGSTGVAPDKSSGLELTSAFAVPSEKSIEEDWDEGHQEGQLAVDVINKEKELIVVSTMSGADTEKLEVYIHNDLLTIRGIRVLSGLDLEEAEFLYQECFWGKFSRTIVLPVDVKGDSAKAEYKNGVLVVKIPKRKSDSKIEVKIVEE